jgi:hypothetical protein
LSLRVTETASKRLDDALENEKKEPRNKGLSRTELGSRLFEVGLHVYVALDGANTSRAREIAALSAEEQMEAIAEVVRLGLAAYEQQHGGASKKCR